MRRSGPGRCARGGPVKGAVVLQSVESDPTKEAPAEDGILNAQIGNASGVASQTTFANAVANKAQLCRVVLRADDNTSGVDQRARVYLAVSRRYA